MKLVKTASGGQTIKISRKEWEAIGRTAGWGGDIKTFFNDVFGRVMKSLSGNASTAFVNSGIKALEDISKGGEEDVRAIIDPLVLKLRDAYKTNAQNFKSVLDQVFQVLQGLKGANATAANKELIIEARSPQYFKNKRKMIGDQDPGEFFASSSAEMVNEVAKMAEDESGNVAALTHSKIAEIAGWRKGAGFTIIVAINLATALVSSMIQGMNGLDEVVTYFTNYVQEFASGASGANGASGVEDPVDA